jgi:hypothetical protein
MNMRMLVDGAAAGCTEEHFNAYHEEVEPAAQQLMDEFSKDLF